MFLLVLEVGLLYLPTFIPKHFFSDTLSCIHLLIEESYSRNVVFLYRRISPQELCTGKCINKRSGYSYVLKRVHVDVGYEVKAKTICILLVCINLIRKGWLNLNR